MPATALRVEDYVGDPPAISPQQLAAISEAIAELEDAFKALHRDLSKLYGKAEGLSSEEVRVVARDLLTAELRHAERLEAPLKVASENYERICHKVDRHTATGRSAIRLSSSVVDIVAGWLETLRDTRIRLELLSSEKGREAGDPDSPVFSTGDDAMAYLRKLAG